LAEYDVPFNGVIFTADPSCATTRTALPFPRVQLAVIELLVIELKISVLACIDGGVHVTGKVTVNDIWSPAAVTFDIFKPPGPPL
jgi:hypothetical protein